MSSTITTYYASMSTGETAPLNVRLGESASVILADGAKVTIVRPREPRWIVTAKMNWRDPCDNATKYYTDEDAARNAVADMKAERRHGFKAFSNVILSREVLDG